MENVSIGCVSIENDSVESVSVENVSIRSVSIENVFYRECFYREGLLTWRGSHVHHLRHVLKHSSVIEVIDKM